MEIDEQLELNEGKEWIARIQYFLSQSLTISMSKRAKAMTCWFRSRQLYIRECVS